ncbi:MAG: T9SS type A sorting domain-containing protein [Bacteroidia bacterium]|nr:T9SS type A sorting domain-containing protein [Bacteroidia bacterium]
MKKHHFLILFTCVLLPFLSLAQEIQWQNTIGGSDEDMLGEIVQTSDGGYIMGGLSYSNISGDKTENSIGSADYWIVKTDSLGVIQWQNTIGGSNYDRLYSLQQTSDGGFILGGGSNSDSTGDKIENSNGQSDYWIVKTDSLGNIQWQNTIGGNSEESLTTLEQTTDGGFILGGWSQSNISGDKTENSNGYRDYWIVKTDSLGVIQWQNTIGGSGRENLRSINQTTDGGYILVGSSESNISGDKTENNIGVYDYWIVKTDSLGIIQWQNTIGGSKWDLGGSVDLTADGGFILIGYSDSNISGDKTENSYGDSDYWIVKIDSLGNIQWQNTIGAIGGASGELGASISQTTDKGYVLGGSSFASIVSGDKTENGFGQGDFWIVKTDSLGIIQWQNTIGGVSSEYCINLSQTNDGGFILGGYSKSNISGEKTENCKGEHDFWIVKITDKYNSIDGKLFIDTNSNGIQDFGELQVVNKMISESSTGRFSFSEQNGNYNVPILNPGSYSVSPALISYYSAVPTSHSAFFSGIHQKDSLNDFAFQPAGVFNDLCVSISPLGSFRAGFNANYMINYINVGTTTLNPTVILFPDNDVNYVNALPAASSVSLDSLVWNFGPLSPFQAGQILVTVNVNSGLPLGTFIDSEVKIEPLTGDANTLCNQSYWPVNSTGSFNSNTILVDEDTLITTQFPNAPFLEYVIHFQNTSNTSVFNVKILNLIDTTRLDLSTFEFVGSSHQVNISWLPWERNMQFMFNNILLPDSNINEPQSHGFVRYRIRPRSNLYIGQIISNYAAIYYDFNQPVLTNTATTRIVNPTSLPEFTIAGNLLLYPNPANSSLTIETRVLMASGSKLTVTDVAGRTLLSKTLNGNVTKHQIDISSFSSGIYFVQLDGGNVIERGRFVKE